MTTQKVFVIFYQPGYGADPSIHGIFSSREKALGWMKADCLYKYDREGIEFEIQEWTVDGP